jgi:metallophosphoesterase superfamily enzyme
MSENQSLLGQLQELLTQKKSKKFYAERLGISEFEVNELLKELREKDNYQNVEVRNYTEERKVNVERGTIESTIVSDFDPKDDLELAQLHKINLDKYVITNYWSKMLPSGKFTSSVFSKKKEAKDYSPEDFAKFLENYKPNNITITKEKYSEEKDYVDVEISIADYHLAKKTVDGDNDPSTRARRYITMAQSLIEKVKANYNINNVVLPISNDFFHTDNYQHQTTNGTPQDTIMDYSEEYELGFAVLVDTINMLRQLANNVTVVLVQGNHDRTKSFYLAHALDVFFRDELDVEFIREHSVIKGITLGNTFIGWHHGNCKLEDLPLLFATHPKYSHQFGDAVYREVHTGDKHHYMAKEVKGVRIQQMPSLSGTDRWHLDNNFVHSVRAALALVYDRNLGKIAEFETRI